jgi:capsule polysaccharide export protein KpsE/RkpR
VTQTATRVHKQAEPETALKEATVPEVPSAGTRNLPISQLWLLWNRRRFLGRAAVAGLVIGTLVAFLLPQRFQSTTQLMPPDTQSSSGMAMLAALSAKAGSTLGSLSAGLLGTNSSGALFMGILSSRTVEDRLVDRFALKKVYGYSLQEDARRKLAENTGMSDDRLSGIITITVTDRSAQRAAAIAQAYVEELNRLVVELSTSAAHRERVFLEERLAAVKQNLDHASKDFSEFSSKSGAIDIKEQGKAMIDAAATLTGQLIAAESELHGLEQIYAPGNVRVRSVQARINELRKQLEKLGGKEQVGVTDPGPDQNENSLYPTLRNLPLLGVHYADLYRQTKIEETVYETLTAEYEMAKVQEAKETPSVKVLDTPIVAERKSWPPRLEIIILCFFLALMAAVVWTLGSAQWAETDARNPGKVLAQEVLQSVNARMPWATPNGSRFQAMTHRIWTRLERGRDSSIDESPSDRS